MAIITELADLKEVQNGSASQFRGTINENFDHLKNSIQAVIDTNISIILSSTQPESGTQRQGDLWLRVI